MSNHRYAGIQRLKLKKKLQTNRKAEQNNVKSNKNIKLFKKKIQSSKCNPKCLNIIPQIQEQNANNPTTMDTWRYLWLFTDHFNGTIMQGTTHLVCYSKFRYKAYLWKQWNSLLCCANVFCSVKTMHDRTMSGLMWNWVLV